MQFHLYVYMYNICTWFQKFHFLVCTLGKKYKNNLIQVFEGAGGGTASHGVQVEGDGVQAAKL